MIENTEHTVNIDEGDQYSIRQSIISICVTDG